MPSNENVTLHHLIHDIGRLLKRRFAEDTREHGLTLPQWRVLGQLKLAGGGLSQVVLANLIESDPMTVSRMVERLESAGLVSRTADPQDSRAKLVVLTGAARELFEKLRPVSQALHEEALRGFSAVERDALFDALSRIQSNIGAEPASLSEEEVQS